MLGENKVTDALGAKVAAVPFVRAADLGTLQDPDNQVRTLNEVISNIAANTMRVT